MKNQGHSSSMMMIKMCQFLFGCVFFFVCFAGCDEVSKADHVRHKAKSKQTDQQKIFVSTLKNFQYAETILFLEAEFSAKLFVEADCLKVHILGDTNHKGLLILNQHQKVIYDKKGGIQTIHDMRTAKNIQVNQNFVASGISYDLSQLDSIPPIPASCLTEHYIIVGEMREFDR